MFGFRKIWHTLFLETPVLRFALLPYYRRSMKKKLVIPWLGVQYDQYFSTFSYFAGLIHEPLCK